jgi:hypothetical protein
MSGNVKDKLAGYQELSPQGENIIMMACPEQESYAALGTISRVRPTEAVKRHAKHVPSAQSKPHSNAHDSNASN